MRYSGAKRLKFGSGSNLISCVRFLDASPAPTLVFIVTEDVKEAFSGCCNRARMMELRADPGRKSEKQPVPPENLLMFYSHPESRRKEVRETDVKKCSHHNVAH